MKRGGRARSGDGAIEACAPVASDAGLWGGVTVEWQRARSRLDCAVGGWEWRGMRAGLPRGATRETRTSWSADVETTMCSIAIDRRGVELRLSAARRKLRGQWSERCAIDAQMRIRIVIRLARGRGARAGRRGLFNGVTSVFDVCESQ